MQRHQQQRRPSWARLRAGGRRGGGGEAGVLPPRVAAAAKQQQDAATVDVGCVIFDLGKVLLDFDFSRSAGALAAATCVGNGTGLTLLRRV